MKRRGEGFRRIHPEKYRVKEIKARVACVWTSRYTIRVGEER